MPFYHRAGSIPPKRHTQFRQADGSLYQEEYFGSCGFSGSYSHLYHVGSPTEASEFRALPPVTLEEDASEALQPHAFDTSAVEGSGDAISTRVPLLFNGSIVISFATPDRSMEHFWRNGLADEVVLVQEGSGTLRTPFGRLPFGPDDLFVIPSATTTQWELDSDSARMLVMESSEAIDTPAHRRNTYGQLTEKSLYCERDVRIPTLEEPNVDRGPHVVQVKHGTGLTEMVLDHHPFDVIGWDGFVFPYALNLLDVEPVTGSIHQMPDAYQILGSVATVICVIPPHPLDYHPLAIPSPPYHNNVDSDELMFTVSGTVPGRRVSAAGHLTFHPRGINHGPKAGAYEASIGVKETDLTAFMIDTFESLRRTRQAAAIEDHQYFRQWLPALTG